MIIEAPRLSLKELKTHRDQFGLVICDEKAITCQNLGIMRQRIGEAGDNLVLMMHEGQYIKGFRGWAKAQILNSLFHFTGVVVATDEDLVFEPSAPWKSVYIPESLTVEERRVMLSSSEQHIRTEFPVTSSQIDQKWIRRAHELIKTSNCWYYPAGSVFTRNDEMVWESVSTSYNHNKCKEIPLDFRELPLNPGERLIFCDSQHAESVGVATAAKVGIRLDGTTMYVSKFPCRPCIQSILGAGIKEVVFENDSYGIPDANLLIENGVLVRRVKLIEQ